MKIYYQHLNSPFGNFMIAGFEDAEQLYGENLCVENLYTANLCAAKVFLISNIFFLEKKSEALAELKKHWQKPIQKQKTEIAFEEKLHSSFKKFQKYLNDLAENKLQIQPSEFDLYLNGTTFQNKVWQELSKIPFGQTTNYLTVAKNINHPKAIQATGSAVGANKIAVLIPCHRVLNIQGQNTGYRWGKSLKNALLSAEAEASAAKATKTSKA